MKPIQRLKNIFRNQLRKSILGKILLSVRSKKEKLHTVCVVSATRLSERDFWRKSALGQSLQPKLAANPEITAYVQYKNTTGLSKIYNTQLQNPEAADILIFVHDDVWLDDEQWVEKIKFALQRFDIVGIAGNTRITKHQSMWHKIKSGEQQVAWDKGQLSGGFATGQHKKGEVKMVGPAPARCRLLDGMLLAISKRSIDNSKILFDEQFDFNFYDMDFCRTAYQAGLSMGTWPIEVTRQSGGVYSGEKWQAACALYFKKWKS